MRQLMNTLRSRLYHRNVLLPLVLFLLLISIDYHRSFPGQATWRVVEAFVGGMLLCYLAFFFWRRRFRWKTLPAETKLLLLMVILVPLISAVSCWISYRQPVWIGLLAERRWAFCITGLFVYRRLQDGHLSATDMRSLFVVLAVATLAVYGILLAWWDLADMRFLRIVALSPAKGYSLRMDMLFPAWAALYLMVLALRSAGWDKVRLAVTALVLWAFLVFIHKDRGLLLALTGAIGGTVLLEQGWRRGVRIGSVLLIGALMLSGLLYALRPSMVRHQMRALAKVGATLTDANGEKDPSTQNRLKQIKLAWKEITRSPRTVLLGNGRLSRRWQGGYRKRFGHYYPIDMGWVGVWYLYGLLGLFAVCMPFVMIVRRLRRDGGGPPDAGDPFLRSLFWFAVLLMIYSLKNGNPGIRPAQMVLVMFLVAALVPGRSPGPGGRDIDMMQRKVP